jgi:putative transposase
MTSYRRAFAPGATYFFTAALNDRSSCQLVEQIGLLRTSLQEVRQRHPFRIDAMVVLPDHIHALWTFPEGDADFPLRWRLLKSRFSQRCPAGESRSDSRVAKKERGIWQRRFWEHLIRDEGDLHRHIDYIHFNPVKHGLVRRVAEWPHSSFHRFVAEGRLEKEWGEVIADDGGYGER